LQSIRTLHVETGMHSLGGPAQVIYLITGLRDRGHDARLVCPKGSSVSRHAAEAGLDVITVPLWTDLDASFVFRLYRIIKRTKPDIVHLHSRRGADIMGGVAARLAHAPAIVLSRRIDNPIRRGLLSKLKYGSLCDRIIAISDAVTSALLEGGVNPTKITRVRSAVDAKAYELNPNGRFRRALGIPAGKHVIGIVGQLIERKGHRYLLDAMPAILERFPDTVLVALGHGPLLARLRHHAKSLGIEQDVMFVGFRNDMPHILRELDVLVHPATMEGLGVAVLQAMAAELPVVTTAAGGMPEAVQDGVSGILVPPRGVEALSDAVIRLLAAPELRRTMGAAGRRIVEEQFSVDGMVEGILSVYRSALGLPRPSVRAAQ